MPTIADKIKDDDKSKILKNVKIVGISIGALWVITGFTVIYLDVNQKGEVKEFFRWWTKKDNYGFW